MKSKRPERRSKRLDKDFSHSTVTVSKLKDDIFLIARDIEQLECRRESVKGQLEELDGELDEVRCFPLDKFSEFDPIEKENELEAIDQEMNRLKFEIERIREKRFRERMKL
jgi:hypothetical protein